MLMLGLWLQWPYLLIEHRRLQPWKILELWCANILALVWFGRFALEHAILGEPLLPTPVADARKQMKVVCIAGASALLLELLFTLALLVDERDSYGRGIVVDATVVSVRKIERAATDWYEVDCRFTDTSGEWRRAHVRVEAERHLLPTGLPGQTIQALTSPHPQGERLRVRYDPHLPARAWADGAGWSDGQRIYWFSLLTLFFQSIITALFLLLLSRFRGESFPWWWDIYKVLPLVTAAFWLFVMGLIDRLMDSI
jgi:hypothetical protein